MFLTETASFFYHFNRDRVFIYCTVCMYLSISAKFIRLVGVYLRSNLNKKFFVVISISNKRTEFILNLLWHLLLVSCCQDWLKSLANAYLHGATSKTH